MTEIYTDLGGLDYCAAATIPGSPSGMTATANGQTRIDLSWNAPSSDGGAVITGYRIEVSENSSSWSDLVANTGSNSTSYSHTGLTPGSTRHYRVSAINSAGKGQPSGIATGATAAAGVPAAPTINGAVGGTDSLTVSWSAPPSDGGSPITAYDLRHIRSDAANKGDANWTAAQDAWTGSGNLSYELTGLDGGMQYDVQVRAVNSAGDGSWSVTATGTPTVEQSPPDPPANAQYQREGTTAIVSWDTSAGATHYKVYYDDFGSPRCSLLSSGRPSGCEELAANLTGASYTHGSPDEDTNYYWIAACNAAGCSDIDSGNTARFVDNRPAAPANAQYVREGSTTVVSWSASAGADYYGVYYDDFFGTSCRLSSGSPSFCELLAGNVTGTTYTHANPDEDRNYYWVVACNSAGCSDIDSGNPAILVETTPSVTAPGAPTSLTATANGQTRIDLSWTAPSDNGGAAITGYRIEVSTDGSSWSDLEAITGSVATSYSHTALTAGDTRHYQVSAINSEGTGQASNVDSATTSQATTGSPDLSVEVPSVSHSQPTPNLIFSLTVTVRNRGDGPSPATTVSYYRATSPTIIDNPSAGNTQVGTTDSVSTLEASDSTDLTVNLTAPSSTGTYYFGACVKTVSGESNTQNNCSSSVAVTVQTGNRPPQLTGDVDDKVVELGESFTVDLSGLFTDPDGDDITSYGFTYRIRGILTGTVNTKTGILSLRAIAVGETIVAVDARDSNGRSGPSEDLFKVTVVAPETADKPSSPTDLSATADGQTVIDLSWTAPTSDGRADITGYRIEVSTSGSSWSDLETDTGSASTSYTHSRLTAGSTRYYRVSAINSAGTGPASTVASATTESLVNNAPTAVGKIPEQVITPRQEVEFDISSYFSDSDGDTLSYSVDSPSLFNRLSVSGNTVRMRNDGLLCEPTTVTVTARDEGGLEATQQFTIRRVNNPPVASSGTFPPQTIDVGERSSPLYMGNWFSDSDTCDSRLTYLAATSDASKVTASASGNTVTVVGVATGSATVTVTARDSGGLEASLDILVWVIAVVQKPSPPTGLTATADGQTDIDLSWSAPSDDGGADITGYKIEVSTNGSSWSVLEADTGSTSTSYTHRGLTAGSTRYYRVSASNSAGTGPASNTDSATTDSAPAPPPTPRPTTDAVTGSISSCEGEQVAPGIDSYRITIEGTVTARRAVENVRVEGTFNGSFVGIAVIGDLAEGETASFGVTGYVSESVGTCGADVEWLEIN